MLPSGHAETCGDAYNIDVEGTITHTVTVPGALAEEDGIFDTVSDALDVQKAEVVNVIAVTTGSGVGDTEPVLVSVQGRGKAGIWNIGNPDPIYFPVDGDNELPSSSALTTTRYQEVRIGKITNPNSGAVTVRIVIDYVY